MNSTFTIKPCYVCGGSAFSNAVKESPIEERFGVPVLPANAYVQMRCKNCGLLFVDCDVTEEYLSALYSKESVDWQLNYTKSSSSETIGRSRISEFSYVWRSAIQVRNPRAGENVLDVGSQTGEFCKIAMSESAVIPFGIELSADYASKCRAQWQGKGHVHVGTIASSNFKKQTFAYVSAQEVLEHMVDPKGALRALHDLLTADGLLVVSVPSSHYFLVKYWLFKLAMPIARFLGQREKDGISRPKVLVHTHLYNFSPKSLKLMLSDVGFMPKRVQGIGWHGKLENFGRFVGGMISGISIGHLLFYPSILCVAVKKRGQSEAP